MNTEKLKTECKSPKTNAEDREGSSYSKGVALYSLIETTNQTSISKR